MDMATTDSIVAFGGNSKGTSSVATTVYVTIKEHSQDFGSFYKFANDAVNFPLYPTSVTALRVTNS